MKKIIFVSAFVIYANFCSNLYGQVSPYNLSPQWHFGNRSGLDFTGGAPVFLGGGQTNCLTGRLEGASSVCDPSGNVVMYTDNYRLYDANHTLISTLRGGTSSTQGSIIIPDPADPADRFYLINANVDHNGGGDKPATQSDLGIYYYHIEKSAGSINILSGPVQLAAYNETGEQICVGTNTDGSYWIVAHQGGAFPPGWGLNKIFSWPVTTAGIGARVVSSVSGTTGNNYWQGSLKINKCQTRLAAVYSSGDVPGEGSLEVYDWDPATGKVTGLIRRVPSGIPGLYGCEFSPDGNILYYTSLSGNRLYQLDIATGTIYTDPSWTSSNNGGDMGTLQLGPDDKIYVLNGSNFDPDDVYLGVVNDPNVPGAGCNYDKMGFTIKNTATSYPNVAWGIANIAFINPYLPEITYSEIACNEAEFDFEFDSYFGDSVAIQSGSIEWDFDDGNGFKSFAAFPKATHAFGASGNYTVKLRFRDNTCGHTWTTQTNVNVTCPMPVEWLHIEAEKRKDQVKVIWNAGKEENNHYFEVQRSEDGIHFHSVGKIYPASSESENTWYSFDDHVVPIGQIYYRIRQVDLDGTYTYSPITSVNSEETEISVYPNPSASGFTLKVPAGGEGKRIMLYNALGQEIFSGAASDGMILGEELSKGTYVLKLISEEEVRCVKLVKE